MARAAPKSKKRPAPKSRKEEKKEVEEETEEVSASEDKEEERNEVSENDRESDNEDQNDEPPPKKGRGRPGTKASKKGKAAQKKTPSRPASKGRKSVKKDESEDEDEEKEYEVEKVMDVRSRKGGREFFIKWKGYSKTQNSWEPEAHLSCDEAIKVFEAEQEKKKNSPVKSLRTAPKETERYIDVVGPGNANKLRHSRRHGKEVRKSYREAPDSD